MASDPTLGVPMAATKTAPTGAVINLATARKNRPTPQQRKAAVEFARRTTGYDSSSPIWNRKINEVLVEIQSELQAVVDGTHGDPKVGEERALLLTTELLKRIATNQLTGAQLK